LTFIPGLPFCNDRLCLDYGIDYRAILYAQYRGHSVLDVVNVRHEFICGHRHDRARLDRDAIGTSRRIPQAGKAKDFLVVQGDAEWVLRFSVRLRLLLVKT
jgi:hypothetical protein